MNNSVFGKTMENIRNHVDIKLCSNEKKLEKLITKPNFEGRTIFAENLVAIHMKKTKIMFDKPIYIRMSILDISKNCTYDFYYDVMKNKYNDDFYSDVKNMINEFDTSYYPIDNVFGMPLVNKKVLGKFKDELNGQIMEEFIGLRSKMYAYKLFENGKEDKKGKGVKKNAVQREICFEDFRICLSSKEPINKKQNLFRTQQHEIFTVEQNKKALSADDDKRHILDNGINSLAWGHYKINMDLYKPPVPTVEKPPFAEVDPLIDKGHDATFL